MTHVATPRPLQRHCVAILLCNRNCPLALWYAGCHEAVHNAPTKAQIGCKQTWLGFHGPAASNATQHNCGSKLIVPTTRMRAPLLQVTAVSIPVSIRLSESGPHAVRGPPRAPPDVASRD